MTAALAAAKAQFRAFVEAHERGLEHHIPSPVLRLLLDALDASAWRGIESAPKDGTVIVKAKDVISAIVHDEWTEMPTPCEMAASILAALSAAGYAVVPVRLTRAMRDAHYTYGGMQARWSAMVAAARGPL